MDIKTINMKNSILRMMVNRTTQPNKASVCNRLVVDYFLQITTDPSRPTDHHSIIPSARDLISLFSTTCFSTAVVIVSSFDVIKEKKFKKQHSYRPTSKYEAYRFRGGTGGSYFLCSLSLDSLLT